MQVKVFEADDMRSALDKVKEVLGPDALILSSRSIDRDGKGSRGRRGIEVTAAVDNDMGSGEAGWPGEGPGNFRARPRSGQMRHDDRGPEENTADAGLHSELREMRRSVQYLTRELSRIKSEKDGTASLWRDFDLSGLGVCPETEDQLSAYAEEHAAGSRDAAGDMTGLLSKFIAERIRVENSMDGSWQGQKRMVFTGPTGVGKTTTIAKVAANFMFETGKSAALATIDNYRIAAAEQLKIYGQIMDIPVEIARSPGQLADIFRRYADRDLIMVDTAGRSPKDEMRIRELVEFLDPGLGTENHLVLSAATSRQGLDTAIDRFSELHIHGLVFTKLDECDLLGHILGAGLKAQRPVSFMTNGQKVPEDLIVPDPGCIASMILNPDEVAEEWKGTEAETRREACAQ